MKTSFLLTEIKVREFWVFKKRESRFRYLKDRLFLASVILYFLNRCIVKPLTIGKIDFFHCYLNDLICIPFWIPIVLFLTRKIRLRTHDDPPDFYELSFFLLLWSYCFEVSGPLYGAYLNYPVADPWDIAYYAFGCVIAGLYWNFEIKRPTERPEDHPPHD